MRFLDKKSLLSFALMLFSFLFFSVPAANALEVNYPGFLPLSDDMRVGELAEVLFEGALMLSGVIAFVLLVYLGFAWITSGENASARADARRRLIALASGVGILLTSVVLLNFINPNLVSIAPVSLTTHDLEDAQAPEKPETGYILGADYEKFSIDEALASIDGALATLSEETNEGNIFARTRALMSQCNRNLCEPGTADYTRRVVYECNPHEEPGPSGEPEDTITVWETCEDCVPDTCTGTACTEGDPLPNRPGADKSLTESQESLERLTELHQEIQTGLEDVRSCDATPSSSVLSCSTAQLLGITTTCDAFTDYFCVASQSSSSPKISLALDAYLEELETLTKAMEPAILSGATASCQRTSFQCGENACSVGRGPCGGGTGCPPELTDELNALALAKGQIEGAITSLKQTGEDLRGSIELISLGEGEASLFSCEEARESVSVLLNTGNVYKNGTCLEGTGCCPSEKTVSSIGSCAPTDRFLCI